MRKKKGFTLIELSVVVIILGILASIGLPYYFKTIETSKANDALAIGHMLANSNRMWYMDHNLDGTRTNDWLRGRITNTCNSGTCRTTSNSACNLIRCNYAAKQDWNQGGNAPYLYYLCNPGSGAGGGCCRSGAAACVMRKTSASNPYRTWRYWFGDDGKCHATGTSVPACPTF